MTMYNRQREIDTAQHYPETGDSFTVRLKCTLNHHLAQRNKQYIKSTLMKFHLNCNTEFRSSSRESSSQNELQHHKNGTTAMFCASYVNSYRSPSLLTGFDHSILSLPTLTIMKKRYLQHASRFGYGIESGVIKSSFTWAICHLPVN